MQPNTDGCQPAIIGLGHQSDEMELWSADDRSGITELEYLTAREAGIPLAAAGG